MLFDRLGYVGMYIQEAMFIFVPNVPRNMFIPWATSILDSRVGTYIP